MKNLHVIFGGVMGGVERLCMDIAKNNKDDVFLVVKEYSPLINALKLNSTNVHSILDSHCKVKIKDLKKVKNCIIILMKEYQLNNIIFHHQNIFLSLLGLQLVKDYSLFLYIHAAFDDVITGGKLSKFINRFLFKKLSQKANKIIAISNYVKETIISFNFKLETKTFVIYNGIDLDVFTPQKNTNISKQCANIVYVGRLTKEKGVQNTIKLLSLIDKKLYNFNIVGEGEYKNELYLLSKKYDINCSFLGRQENINEILRENDIFIHLPEWDEGFGISVVEAMATGLIIVVNEKGALKEIISNENNGYILNSLDYRNSINTVNRIINETINNQNGSVRIAALNRAKDFSIEKTCSEIELLKEG